MGANFVAKTIRAKNHKELEKAVEAERQNQGYDSGFGSYSGNWTQCDGLAITEMEFSNSHDAYAYLQSTCMKWENLIAVKVNEIKNGKPDSYYLVGGWCAS